MSNEYYSLTEEFGPITLARTGALNREFSSIESAFAKLPASASLNSGSVTFFEDTGTDANAYVVVATNVPIAPTRGASVAFYAKSTNTGSATLTYGSWGAKALRRLDGSELEPGDIKTGQLIEARYHAPYWTINAVVYGEIKQAKDAAATAVSSADNAATSLSSFFEYYIGPSETDPENDLNGDPVSEGQFYWNTTTKKPRIHDGTEFVTAVFDTNGAVFGPGSSTDNNIPQWDGTTGAALKDGLAVGTSANNLVQLNGSAELPAVSGANLTDLPASGGSATFTASGAIPTGQVVTLNTDGTVSIVDPDGTNASIGSSVFDATSKFGAYAQASYCADQNAVVVTYSSGGTYVVAGTVNSDKTITWGSAVLADASGSYSSIACNTTNNEFCLVYSDGQGRAMAGTVSGNSVTLGSESAITGGSGVSYLQVAYNPGYSGTYVFACTEIGLNYLKGGGISTSGTSVSSSGYGNLVALSVGEVYGITVLDSGLCYVFFRVTSPSFGAVVGFYQYGAGAPSSVGSYAYTFTFTCEGGSIARNGTSNEFLVVATNQSDADVYGCAVTCSGTTPTAGSSSKITAGSFSTTGLTFDTINDTFVAAYVGSATSLTVNQITQSGTAFTTSTDLTTTSQQGNTNFGKMAYVSDLGFSIFPYYLTGGSSSGAAIIQPDSTNASKWIGLASEAIADTATGTVTILGGTNDQQSGLTIGSDYYIDVDGTLTTTVNNNPKIGKALSATELLVTGDS